MTALDQLLGVGLVALCAASCADRPLSPASPGTTNVFVQDIRQTELSEIDLLFVIDNSASMADKQALLAEAVPQLLRRLVLPDIDPSTGKPEFEPIVDIHIGVVSSSLGGHGGDACSKTAPRPNPTQNDHGHLIGSVRPNAGLESHQGLGFLWWDPTGYAATPPGEGDLSSLLRTFAEHVSATGESGCGYEAQLESWYRFLVDPAPPADVVVANGIAQPKGVDEVVVQQRKDFLRPNSLVAIVMLTDENDCSIVDGGHNWLAAQNGAHLPRAASSCAQDPDSPCCRPCDSVEASPPAGCPTLTGDPECAKGVWDDAGDHPNLRCWQQKQRFGADFLYPTRRYVEALTQPRICPTWDANGPVGCQYQDPHASGYRVCNPLYVRDLNAPDECETGSRDPALIYFAGVVGVPWQDIATDDTLHDPTRLEYLTADKITERDRWKWLVPECARTVSDQPWRPENDLPRSIGICDQWNRLDQPDDALMVESSLPRTGTALALGVPLAHPSGGDLANPINGHEWNTFDEDLQYACIFELPKARDCGARGSGACDCDDAGIGTGPYPANNPLCQNASGQYTPLQRYAKAFPGTRELQVLKDFGTNSIVASICPKVTGGDKGDPSYGYNPAVAAITERLAAMLDTLCLNRPVAFPRGPDGEPDPAAIPRCAVVEVLPKYHACGACDPSRGRSAVDPVVIPPVLERLYQTGQCMGANCTTEHYCMCAIDYAKDRETCEQTGDQPNNFGWCYVDPSQGVGNPALVEDCRPARQLIFSGHDTPTSGATVVLTCLGAPR